MRKVRESRPAHATTARAAAAVAGRTPESEPLPSRCGVGLRQAHQCPEGRGVRPWSLGGAGLACMGQVLALASRTAWEGTGHCLQVTWAPKRVTMCLGECE